MSLASEAKQKQVSEELVYDFRFDYSGGIAAGASISSVDSIAAVNCGVVSGSSSVTVSGQTSSGRVAQAKVAGGTHGESYKLTAKVTDSTGQKHEVDGLLEVVDQ